MLYGDKVTNLRNHHRDRVFPEDTEDGTQSLNYVATARSGLSPARSRSEAVKKGGEDNTPPPSLDGPVRSGHAASAALWSSTLSLRSPIWIFRGFIASGISRTSVSSNSPSCRSAPVTSTWSASVNFRSKDRFAIP